MVGSKLLLFIGVILLVGSGFIAGRYSIGDQRAAEPAAKQVAKRQHKAPLSALPSSSDQRPLPVESKSVSKHPEPSADRDERNAATASEFLASLAEKLEDELGDLEPMAEIIGGWLEKNPDEAIAWLARGERRNEILGVIFAIWGAQNSEAAAAWLGERRNMQGFDSAAAGLVISLAHSDDEELALDWVDAVTDPVMKAKIWNLAGAELYGNDPEAALDRLANSELAEELQQFTRSVWRSALDNKAKRNAQNLASVYSSAVAAGATFEGGSAAEIVREVVQGVNGADSFSNTRFQVPNMAEEEIEAALRNLQFDSGSLNYDAAKD